jgi:hypothetical protein
VPHDIAGTYCGYGVEGAGTHHLSLDYNRLPIHPDIADLLTRRGVDQMRDRVMEFG